MCDGIANGPPRWATASSASCPPANVTIASNVLSTNGNVICGNIISQDGTFTGNLYVAGQIVGNIIYDSINISGTANISVLEFGTLLGGLDASNITTGTLDPSHLALSGVVAGQYGDSSNISQVAVDQYGRVTAAANIGVSSSQWTTVSNNLAYQNGVSIGTLSGPPPGSNLYVFGTATADFFTGDGSGINNINSSNLIGNVAIADVALVVSQAYQPNITSLGI